MNLKRVKSPSKMLRDYRAKLDAEDTETRDLIDSLLRQAITQEEPLVNNVDVCISTSS